MQAVSVEWEEGDSLEGERRKIDHKRHKPQQLPNKEREKKERGGRKQRDSYSLRVEREGTIKIYHK